MVSVATKAMEAYRVLKSFQWNGWMFAPDRECRCSCRTDSRLNCPGHVGMDCECKFSSCHCDCGIPSDQYAGDVWLVEPGNLRKESMLSHRFAVYDASLPSVDELLTKEKYQKVIRHWVPNAPVITRRSKG